MSINSAMKKLAYRNSIQSKSQNKKPFNDIKNMINSLQNTPANKANNYINLKNNNMYMNENMSNNMNNNNINILQNINNQIDKNQMKTYQQKKMMQNSNLNAFQNGYRNRNIFTYQGNNDRTNTNFIKNDNYINNSFQKMFLNK